MATTAAPAAADDAAELERALPAVTAAPGRDRAAVRPPPWCAAVTAPSSPTFSQLGRTLDGSADNASKLLDGARQVCALPRAPVIAKATAVIVQSWINYTGLAEAEAVASIEARLAGERFKADKLRLCDALVVPEEQDGPDKEYMTARRLLFGCVPRGWADRDPLWLDGREFVTDALLPYLDQSAVEPDELVRVAWILTTTRPFLRPDVATHVVLHYVFDQVDYKAFAPAKLLALLDAPPYQGNSYARAIVHESLARARLAIAATEAVIAAKASDAAWKELLIDAPARALARWSEAAAKWRAQLARSNAFEHALLGPSRKATQGCLATLRPDAEAIIKALPRDSEAALRDALSTDPVAGLIFVRFAACAAVDGEPAWAERLLDVPLRGTRGPRLAAQHAALDALSAILADRDRFPVAPTDFLRFKHGPLRDRARSAANKAVGPRGDLGERARGTIKSVRRTAGGVELVWSHVGHRDQIYDCKPTHRIERIADDGRVIYREDCRATGRYKQVDTTPVGVTVPARWAAGLAPGAIVEVAHIYGATPAERIALPLAAYRDASRRHLVNILGFGL